MNGLLSDPQGMGLLSLGLRLMSTPGGFASALGQSGMGALGDMQRVEESVNRRKTQAMQEQMLQMQLEQAKRASARQQQMESAATQSYTPGTAPHGMSLGDGEGDITVPGKAAAFDMKGFAERMAALGDPSYLIQMMPKPEETKYHTVNGSLVRTGGGGVGEVFRAPEKPEKMPEALRTLALIHGEGSPEYLAAAKKLAQKMTTHQPGTNVSINTGQKGYENESKLRNDFKSEPIYKEYNDMKTAYAQITSALKQGTPIGDTAAATKIMKLLDPGSVVRESELGMAMAAAGKMDRLENFLRMQMSGEKLTPTQRTDFGALAAELMRAASQAYNAKRSEYENFGKQYQLNPSVLGPAAVIPQPEQPNNDGFSIRPLPGN